MNLTIQAKNILKLFPAAVGIILVACSGPIPTPIVTPTLPATEIPTSTIVWFPPTNTPTLFPTQPLAPIANQRPGVGELIFTDSFDQPEMWNTSASAQASATLARNQLVLSITGPGPLSIVSLRSQPVLGDFYAEAMVDISLCSSKDQFGMIFRAADGGNYYRYTVTCNSQQRLERVRGGETYPLLDWLSSGDAPSGAPARVKLGVWAVGREMRFFLNDQFQFSQPDPVFSSGTVGFFVFASGQSPVTVSFSNLAVYSVFYTSPIPSPLPSPTPHP